jgi:hypothetical protein
MNITFGILSLMVSLAFAAYAIKKGMNSLEPKELDIDYIFKKEAALRKKLSGFPVFTLNPIQNGKVEIILAKCGSQSEFKKMAKAFAHAIDCKVEERIDGVSEQVWTISKNGISLCLSWDDMVQQVTLFAWEGKDDNFIRDLFQRLEKIRK